MPARRTSAIQPEQFATFGQLLRFLRQRAGLTQRELSIAVGYSESQMSRLEQNQRAPDPAALAARFVPALHLETEPEWAARLLALGEDSRAEAPAPEPIAGEVPLSPNNLPVQLTSFIGREAELAEIRQILTPTPSPSPSPERELTRSGEGEGWRDSAGAGVRLLTLTGPGGTGKTRLALQAAARLLAQFPDGVWWVELAPVADPALVPQTVASVLGVKEEPGRPVLATLTDHLRRKRVLLILDNCEHIIQSTARLAEAVLRACPQVCLLASSRELLGVGGERAVSVPSLRSPEPNEPLSPDSLRQYEAVQLFLDRAAATAPRFALTPANAPAIVQICQRLDGIPLALELAAARLRMLPVEQLAARLDDAFRLLTGGSRTALPRHQTLQALIDWSYDLLPPTEQALLRRLAVFAGGWTLEAAEAVCAGEELASAAVAELLGRLIDKSLVLVEERAGVARYRLMETVRQYAQAKLAASGEADETRRRHALFFLDLAESGPSEKRSQAAYLEQLALEHDNLHAALMWAQGRAESFRLIGALWFMWYSNVYVGEGLGVVESALAHPDAAKYPNGQAEAMILLGVFTAYQGNFAAGQEAMTRGLAALQALGDRPNIAFALERLGWLARERGDASTARARLEESLALYRELSDQPMLYSATNTLGEIMILQGDLEAAKNLLTENLALARRIDNATVIGWALNHLGHVAQLQGDYAEAQSLHEASLPVFKQLAARHTGLIWAYRDIGETCLARGDAAAAARHFAEAITQAREVVDPASLAWSLAGMAGAAVLDEAPERAAWLWGAAEKLRLSLGVREAPCSHATHERLKAQAREQIGEAAFAAHSAEGEAVSLSTAIERALRPDALA